MSDLKTKLKLLEDEYQTLSANIESQVQLEHKNLDTTMKDQINMQVKWERFFARVIAAYEQAKDDSEYEFANAYKIAVSDSYKDMSSTDAKFIAGCDSVYRDAKKLENKFYKLKKEVEAVCSVIETRKYVLKDMTASIIHGVNKVIL